MRAVARVEDRIVFEDRDGGFDGVEGVATIRQHRPAGTKSAETAGIAGVNRFIGNVPGTPVNNERRLHGARG